MRFSLLIRLLLGIVSLSSVHVSAQGEASEANAQAEISAVKFSAARPDSGGDSWLEILIEMNIKPGGKQLSGQFLDRVRVTLSLGVEVVGTSEAPGLAYYQSSAEIITVESGKTAVRFYLPPEVLKRDKVRGEPKFYLVEVDAGGTAQTPSTANVSKSINSPSLLSGFKNRLNTERARTEGVLMPQYLTPFATDSRRPFPTFFRREAQR